MMSGGKRGHLEECYLRRTHSVGPWSNSMSKPEHLRFHVSTGPPSLFDRVRFMFRERRTLKLHAEHFGDRAAARGIPISVVEQFDARDWELMTVEVGADTGKFVSTAWRRTLEGRTWWVVIGFHDTVRTVFDGTGKIGLGAGIVTSGERYEYVGRVNSELMRGAERLDNIERLRRAMLSEYPASIGLAPDARYISGAPLRPVVPLDVGTEAGTDVFIVGAYPSARFGVVGGEQDVPMADNLGPFEPERYYDGARVRVQDSAAELDEHYLKPLGVTRGQCWITDLVKVFLFKAGHRRRYSAAQANAPAGYEREAFEDLGRKSLPWIERELKLARPKLVITLGREVAGVVTGVDGDEARNSLLGGEVRPVRFGSVEIDTAHLPHPGVLMRGSRDGAKSDWAALNPKFVAELAGWLRARR